MDAKELASLFRAAAHGAMKPYEIVVSSTGQFYLTPDWIENRAKALEIASVLNAIAEVYEVAAAKQGEGETCVISKKS